MRFGDLGLRVLGLRVSGFQGSGHSGYRLGFGAFRFGRHDVGFKVYGAEVRVYLRSIPLIVMAP